MCLARVVQGALFENCAGLFFGCQYCQYSAECGELLKKSGEIHFDYVRRKLQDMTEVDLGYQYDRNNPEAKFKNTTTHNSGKLPELKDSPCLSVGTRHCIHNRRT